MFRFLQLPKLDNDIHNAALILLTESRNIIWNSRNKCKHERSPVTSYSLVAKFLSNIKFRMSVDLQRLEPATFGHKWCDLGLATLNLNFNTRDITYDPALDINTYSSIVPACTQN